MANLRLRRLKISKFRNVVPGTELVFSDGMNVLLGRNGTGKTTLLQLIAATTSSRWEALVDEELDVEYDISFLDVSLRVHLSNRVSHRGARLDDGPPSGRSTLHAADWELSIGTLSEDGQMRPLLSATPLRADAFLASEITEKISVPVRDPLRDAGPLDQFIDLLGSASRSLEQDARNKGNRGLTVNVLNALRAVGAAMRHRVDAQGQGGRFDEDLGVFYRITRGVGSASRVEHFPSLVLQRVSSPKFHGVFVPQELLVQLNAMKVEPGALTISLEHEGLPFLRRCAHLFGFEAASAVMRLLSKDSAEHGGMATYGAFDFLFKLADESFLQHESLSFGQKRLLSFLYYAAANPDIIIADELVNGLHHEWIEACLDEIQDRQCFLTSQNPLLLDYLSFESAEEVRRTFLLCDRRKDEKRTQLVWRHMDDEAAAAFFRAYRAGVQHVSEILRTRGLW